MGILSRMSTVFKTKVSKLLDKAEDPAETLEYSYHKQMELMQKVKRGLAGVVTSKKRLELQAVKLRETEAKLEGQAKQALKAGREDLARTALQRKTHLRSQLDGLEEQIAGLEQEQDKLQERERRLRAKVEAFRTRKEVIKAQYSAAEAGVRIGEASGGLSEELADVGMAMDRAQEKTEDMKARAAAIDELAEEGALDDPFASGKDDIDRELAKISGNQQVDDEMARLKKEVGQA